MAEVTGNGGDHPGEESSPSRTLDAGMSSFIATATTLDEDANGEDPKSGPDEEKETKRKGSLKTPE